MKIKVVECLDWKAPDKPGELLRYAEAFKKRDVNLEALWSCGCCNGAITAVAKKPAKLSAALKAMGVRPRKSKCFYLSGKDKTGVLVDVLKKLAAARINVNCSAALAAQGKFGCVLWVKDSVLSKARRLLKA